MSEREDELRRHLAEFDNGRLTDADIADRLGDPPPGVIDDDGGAVRDDDAPVFVDDAPDARDQRIAELEAERDQLTQAEAEREDRAELQRVTEYVRGLGTGMNDSEIESAILSKYIRDDDFRSAYDQRRNDPLSWEMARESLADEFPSSDYQLGAAVRAARDVPSSVRSESYGDWSRMGTHEFDAARKRVFRDHADGKLPSSPGGTGGYAPFRTVP